MKCHPTASVDSCDKLSLGMPFFSNTGSPDGRSFHATLRPECECFPACSQKGRIQQGKKNWDRKGTTVPLLPDTSTICFCQENNLIVFVALAERGSSVIPRKWFFRGQQKQATGNGIRAIEGLCALLKYPLGQGKNNATRPQNQGSGTSKSSTYYASF